MVETTAVFGQLEIFLLGSLLGMVTSVPESRHNLEIGCFTGMTCVVVTLETGPGRISGSDLAQEVGHLNRSQSRVEPFVAPLGTRAFDGLFEGVGRQHAENDRF